MLSKFAAAAVALAAALSLAACSDDAEPPAPDAPVTSTDAPDEGFTGDPQTESIKVGPMDVTVPVGIKLPDDSIVTESQDFHLMIIDEDPQHVIDEVRASAETAGYEMYKEITESKFVLVGHGNAVLLDAVPNAQMMTWGPEAMKDALG
ncbi:MAG: hypothetical protein Q4G35_06505 [Propionibacteriaceae bacterium]|nr:hypothetical protein [Propionibacteriaceae bacterium]